MEVRRASPDAVERLIRVAVGLPEVAEPILGFRVEPVLIGRELGGIGVETMTVGVDRRNRLDGADAGAGLDAVTEAMVCVTVEAGTC